MIVTKLLRGLSCVAILAVSAHATPRADISPLELDLGKVKPGTLTERTIAIKNTGDEPLTIMKVQSSCPCAIVSTPEGADATVQPGATYNLPVTYDPKDRVGDQNASIAIETNDPENPFQIVEVTVFVEVLVVVRPPTGIVWGLVPRGQRINKTLDIAPGDSASDIELLDIKSMVPGIAVTTEMKQRGDERYIEVSLSVKSDQPLGSVDSSIDATVKIGNDVAELSIPVRGEVIGDLLISPPAINSPKTAYAQGQKISEITVRTSTGGAPPDVLGAMVVGPLRAIIQKNAEPDAHKIMVHSAENAPPGPQGGTVYVMTSSADEPIVAVPIYFRSGSPVEITPEFVALNGKTEVRVELKAGGEAPVSITNIGFEQDVVNVQVTEENQTGDRPALLTVTPAQPINADKRTTIVVVETNIPGASRLHIPVVIGE